MSPFKVSIRENYLHLEFHIPESSNAFSLTAARALTKIVNENRNWRKPVVVTSGHRRMFCSGGNLSDYKKLKGRRPGVKINREIASALDKFGAWKAPKLALIEGDVLGGGIEWLARFDYRWSSPHAYFSFWQKRIGLSSGWTGGRAWALKIGDENVRRLLIEGALLSAEASFRAGLIDRILPSWKMWSEVERWSPSEELLNWSSAAESKIFSALWMGQKHKAILAKWKG